MRGARKEDGFVGKDHGLRCSKGADLKRGGGRMLPDETCSLEYTTFCRLATDRTAATSASLVIKRGLGQNPAHL